MLVAEVDRAHLARVVGARGAAGLIRLRVAVRHRVLAHGVVPGAAAGRPLLEVGDGVGPGVGVGVLVPAEVVGGVGVRALERHGAVAVELRARLVIGADDLERDAFGANAREVVLVVPGLGARERGRA